MAVAVDAADFFVSLALGPFAALDSLSPPSPPPLPSFTFVSAAQPFPLAFVFSAIALILRTFRTLIWLVSLTHSLTRIYSHWVVVGFSLSLPVIYKHLHSHKNTYHMEHASTHARTHSQNDGILGNFTSFSLSNFFLALLCLALPLFYLLYFTFCGFFRLDFICCVVALLCCPLSKTCLLYKLATLLLWSLKAFSPHIEFIFILHK